MALQDEIGYAIGREGGSAIDYWRRGHIPRKQEEALYLARELIARDGFSSRAELESFLASAGDARAREISLHMMPDQPKERVSASAPAGSLETFVVGPAILHSSQFFGRQVILQRLFGLLLRTPMQHALLIGPRRSGKTSLLNYLRAITTTPACDLRPNQRRTWLSMPDSYRWIYVNFHDAQMRRRQTFFAHVLNELGVEPSPDLDLFDFLNLVRQHIQAPTVILMDEISAALSSAEFDQEFWWGLRSLATNLPYGDLGYVLTSDQHPLQASSDQAGFAQFFNLVGYEIPLGPFTESEARELIASSPIPFPSEDVNWMLRESGLWPAVLQKMCAERLFDLENQPPDRDGWRRESLTFIQRCRDLVIT